MTTINRSMYPIQTGFDQISKMQERFAQLQVQLATGQKASNLAEMGTDRYFDLSIRARLGKIEGFQNTITMVNLRLDVFDKAITRLDAVEAEARTGMVPGGYGSSNLSFGTAPSLAQSRLDEVLGLLNTDVDGRYLFGGSATDRKPVETLGAVLDGAAGRAGFRTVAAERKAADLGADGLGRLTLATATDTVTLAEDGTHPFGLKLSTLSTSSAAITLTQPTGAPPALAVQFTGQPLEGETVTIGLTLPDGTEEGITLKAVSGTPAAGEFQIGADPATTAANFSAALGTALTTMGKAELSAASTHAAAENFFNGQGTQVMRVDGPPYETATGLVAADPATTVFWYKGGDDANARQSVSARIDESARVDYGAQANETGLLDLVRGLAVVAVQSFPSDDPTSKARFDAVASRNISLLSEGRNSEQGSIEMIAVEMGNARAAAARTGERQTAYAGQLKTMLDEIGTVTTEEVAMEMLALQTRLAASYQATSIISQMSFVNYMS